MTRIIRRSSRAIGLSAIMTKIINGLSIAEVKVINQPSILTAISNFFGGLYVSLEEFAFLYFLLPAERFNEFEAHLKTMASDFVGWQIFYNQHRYASEAIKKMILRELLKKAESFNNYHDVSKIAEGYPELKTEALKGMKLLSQRFEEKIICIQEGLEPPNHEEIKDLFDSATEFKHYESFAALSWIPTDLRIKSTRMMLEKADSFDKNVRTFNRAKPGSKIRQKCVTNADLYELPLEEVFSYYYSQKRWNNFKRGLYKRIEQFSLGAKDWFKVIDNRDKKIKKLAFTKIRDLNLKFEQLNEIQNISQDSEIELFLLEEMVLKADPKNFEQWKKICRRADKFPKIKKQAFPRLINIVKNSQEGEEISGMIGKNSQYGKNLFTAIIRFEDTPFEVFDNLFRNSSNETQTILLPYLRRSASNFTQTERAFILCLKNKRQQDLCLQKMFEIAEETDQAEHLVRTYKLALETKNAKIIEKILNRIKIGKYEFSFLNGLYKQLIKENAANNGLADLTERMLITTAKTETEKTQAFICVPVEKKNLALEALAATN